MLKTVHVLFRFGTTTGGVLSHCFLLIGERQLMLQTVVECNYSRTKQSRSPKWPKPLHVSVVSLTDLCAHMEHHFKYRYVAGDLLKVLRFHAAGLPLVCSVIL